MDERAHRRALALCALCWVTVFVMGFVLFHNEVYEVLKLHDSATLHGHEEEDIQIDLGHAPEKHENHMSPSGVNVESENAEPEDHHVDAHATTPPPEVEHAEHADHADTEHHEKKHHGKRHAKQKQHKKKKHAHTEKEDADETTPRFPPISAEEASRPTNPRAILHTTQGLMVWELFPNEAPKSVALFTHNAQSGIYNGSCFYRYERGFVLQGGFNCLERPKGAKRSGKTVPLEYKIRNDMFNVALARAGKDLHSGGTEFFINLRNNTNSLGRRKNGGYAVFARVLDEQGTMETISTMKKLQTHKSGLMLFNKPQPVIEHIEILEKDGDESSK